MKHCLQRNEMKLPTTPFPILDSDAVKNSVIGDHDIQNRIWQQIDIAMCALDIGLNIDVQTYECASAYHDDTVGNIMGEKELIKKRDELRVPKYGFKHELFFAVIKIMIDFKEYAETDPDVEKYISPGWVDFDLPTTPMAIMYSIPEGDEAFKFCMKMEDSASTAFAYCDRYHDFVSEAFRKNFSMPHAMKDKKKIVRAVSDLVERIARNACVYVYEEICKNNAEKS